MRCFFGFILMLLAGGAHAGEGARVYLEEFRLGSPDTIGWRALNPARAVAACHALGFDCSDDPDPSRAATRFLKRVAVSGAYRGTAQLLRQSGNSYYASFETPPGFRICKAGIDLKGGTISPGAKFGGSIQRAGRDGLGVYAALPDGPSTSGIAFRLLVAVVAEDRFSLDQCWPDGTILFLCPGQERCRASRAYPEVDLR